MSISLAATAVIAQLCYQPAHDIGSHEFMKVAQVLETRLVELLNVKETSCLTLTSQAELQEARMLVAADATKKTLVLEQ